jgi:hypothetical protein
MVMQAFAANPAYALRPQACATDQIWVPCVGRRLDWPNTYAAVDLERALEDFDGDVTSVSELLSAFVLDRNGCLSKLQDLAGAGLGAVVVAVRDVANTLDAGWCREAALAVRHLDEQLRRDAACDVSAVVAQVHAIAQQAFDGVETVVRGCPQCLQSRLL